MATMKDLLEARQDLGLYKRLVDILLDYCDKRPATHVTTIFNSILEVGVKSIPKDRTALLILRSILVSNDNAVSKVQKLLNTRFTDLPANVRPVCNKPGVQEVAFWEKGGKVYDRVFSLISAEGEGNGSWSDAHGNSVKLVDLKNEGE